MLMSADVNMNEIAFKDIYLHALVLDEKGNKMSKSKGNIVKPFDLMNEFGSDVIRFYLPYVSPVWTPIKFDNDGLKEVNSKYLSYIFEAASVYPFSS